MVCPPKKQLKKKTSKDDTLSGKWKNMIKENEFVVNIIICVGLFTTAVFGSQFISKNIFK